MNGCYYKRSDNFECVDIIMEIDLKTLSDQRSMKVAPSESEPQWDSRYLIMLTVLT